MAVLTVGIMNYRVADQVTIMTLYTIGSCHCACGADKICVQFILMTGFKTAVIGSMAVNTAAHRFDCMSVC